MMIVRTPLFVLCFLSRSRAFVYSPIHSLSLSLFLSLVTVLSQTTGIVELANENGEKSLKVPEKARHYGYTKQLSTPFDPRDGFAIQFEAAQTEGLDCGGAYLKYLTEEANTGKEMDGSSPYVLMFGPDKCGSNNKVHVIFKHKSPKDGELEEKHLKDPPKMPSDKAPHMYTLLVNTKEHTYEVKIDGKVEKEGSIFEDFEPPFKPPKMIDDPEDSKPEDWVDEKQIPDPNAKKPDDWDEDAPMEILDEEATKPEGWLDDEPEEIEDPEAEEPEDWDEEEDGEYEAPLVPNPRCEEAPGCGEWEQPMKENPDYKGPWSAPMIDNVLYKGEWAPKQIENPKYYEDSTPFENVGKISAVALEIWTMSDGLTLDNILISKDFDTVDKAAETFDFEAKKEAKEKALKEAEEKAAEEAEKAAEKAEKAEAKKAANAAGFPGKVTDLMYKVVEKIPGKAGEVLTKPVDFMAENVAALYAFLATSLLSILYFILSPFVKDAKKTAATKKKVGKAKKTDEVQEDDDEEEEEEEEEEDEKPKKKNGRSKK